MKTALFCILLIGTLWSYASAIPVDPTIALQEEIGFCRQGPLGETPRVLFRPAEVERDTLHGFNVLSYRLQLRVDSAGPGFSAQVRVTLTADDAALDRVQLMANNLTITAILDSATGDPIPFEYDGTGTLAILPTTPIPARGTVAWDIHYQFVSYDRMGYYYYNISNYTMSEPYDARFWMPCYDLPCDRALFSVRLTIPPGRVASANGTLRSVETGPDGWRSFDFACRDSMATYHMCFNWGDFIHVSDTAHPAGLPPIPLNYYINPADSLTARVDFERTGAMLEYYTDLFGPYPFESYGHTMIDTFYWGGMEHVTLSSLNRRYISGYGRMDGLICHELSHMWFGDCLTPLNFEHIWLNEGFATYAEYIWKEHYEGEASSRDLRALYRNYYLSEWWGGRHYPTANPPFDDMFGNTVYKKGGWILHMLRRQMGDVAFYQGMRNYYAHHFGGHVTTPEWCAEMNAAAGTDYGWFFDQWLYGIGHPSLECSWTSLTAPSGHTFVLYLNQVQTEGDSTFAFPATIRLHRSVGDTDVTVWMDSRGQWWAFPQPTDVDSISFDPNVDLLCEYRELHSSVESMGLLLPPDLAVTPSPLRQNGKIAFRLPTGQEGVLRLVDLSGRVLWQHGVSGSGELDWAPPAAIGAGSYRMTLESGQQSVSVGVVVIR